MSNFTPGPWAIIHETMVMSGNRSIASCGGYYSNMDSEKVRAENIANARLIAAAPELKKELTTALALVRLKYGNMEADVWKWQQGVEALLGRIDAAMED